MSVVLAEAGPKESILWRRVVLERLHRVFALIIVLQLIQPFQEFWWSETYRVVYAALAVYGASELLFSRLLWLRLIIQAAGAAGATLLFARADWLGWPQAREWPLWREFLTHNSFEMHPYLELALLALFACHALAHWGTTKRKAIVLTLLAVTTLAAVDSFFPFELWRSIIWTVAAGLGWLVVLHLRMLREMHFDSWSSLAERPFELLLPALIVIGLLIVLGILMPRAPSLLEDPYTLWMQSQDKDIPSFAGEGGTLITGSSSSSGGQSSTKSGYGRNDSQIGGGFQYDYSPVMQVTTNLKSYLRGETKAVYTGKGWSDLKGQESVAVATGTKSAQELPLEPEMTDAAGIRKVEQTVIVLRKDRLSVLFAASPASSLVELDSSRNAQLFWNPDERELRFQRPASVESYTVVSEVQELDEEKLRALTADSAESANAAPDEYDQLPDSLPERVKELAQTVTAGATNDYDRLKLLEQYLRSTYPYTNTPDVSKQASKDVVDAFLFEIQEGYCDYYSTAFVVMARTLGVPTRWVKGYTAGVNPSAEEEARYGGGYVPDPDGAGTYTVRNADAHSWAEAYFEGYGWVSFEPTAGFSFPAPVPEQAAEVVPLPVSSPSETPVTEAEASGASWTRPALIAAGAVVLALLLGGAWLIVRRRGGLLLAMKKLRHFGLTPNQRIVKEMESFLRFMQRRGFKRSKDETMRETFGGWGGRFGSLKPELEGVLLRFEGARYGSGDGAEEEYEHFSQLAEKIRKAL
ncbi:DUF4129 domain-containing transglutaminase family protein [Cohnella fermenti]|uniref:Transglutaminase domain-containing protein n=1 Tax=Cohnella fermenti TaxID=2565925 RepID=A0A4S4BK93_9BACL|nr:transglutaminase domain-containing protein [Cohnella fermenti]THF75039.1 transglutaminase domain-containing protein [Cohnella fermenti]